MRYYRNSNTGDKHEVTGTGKAQFEEAAKLEKFIRHVRNFDIGPHPIRAEGVDANRSLEVLMGDDYEKIFKTKEWKS